MARIPKVTRTIQTTHCSVLCMDLEKREPCNIDVVLPRTYKDEQDMLKAVKKHHQTNNIIPVQIVAHMVQETLYGMSEQDFIAHATILPPRNSTAVDDDVFTDADEDDAL